VAGTISTTLATTITTTAISMTPPTVEALTFVMGLILAPVAMLPITIAGVLEGEGEDGVISSIEREIRTLVLVDLRGGPPKM
jgi:hypothetical protein